MWSFGAKIVSETGPLCDFRSERAPRWGVDVEGPTFWRLKPLEAADGTRDSGADGASDFLVDQKPTEWSEEAERIRFEGW